MGQSELDGKIQDEVHLCDSATHYSKLFTDRLSMHADLVNHVLTNGVTVLYQDSLDHRPMPNNETP